MLTVLFKIAKAILLFNLTKALKFDINRMTYSEINHDGKKSSAALFSFLNIFISVC